MLNILQLLASKTAPCRDGRASPAIPDYLEWLHVASRPFALTRTRAAALCNAIPLSQTSS